MRHRQVRRQCEALVATLEIPDPFDLDAFCSQLGDEQGRPIQQLAMPLPAAGPCGLLLSTDDVDVVIFEQHTTLWHQRHIVLHELGHILWGHAREMSPATSRKLLPHLDPDMVRRMLGRTNYSELEEHQAEMVASLILERVIRWAPATTYLQALDEALLRVEASLRGHWFGVS
jgi:hypothetical protein